MQNEDNVKKYAGDLTKNLKVLSLAQSLRSDGGEMERFSRPGNFRTISPSSTDMFSSHGSSLDGYAMDGSVLSETYRDQAPYSKSTNQTYVRHLHNIMA